MLLLYLTVEYTPYLVRGLVHNMAALPMPFVTANLSGQ
jgi:hypothetical protein